MVSDGIDDVYAAGYDAGGGGVTPTSITPSNSSPASMTAGTDYEPTANGYAIESYTELDPSNSEPWPTITSGTIYKAVDNGYAIESVNTVTPSNSNPLNLRPHAIYSIDENYREGGYLVQSEPTALTPDNSSPPAIASGTIYKGGGTGKAIASIATNGNGVTPSPSGKYFYSGWNRMTSAGYAYSSQPSSGYTYGWDSATTLWTNSAPTTNFSLQSVTLSSGLSNYNYIRFTVRRSTSDSTTKTLIVPRSELTTYTSSSPLSWLMLPAFYSGNTYAYGRAVYYESNTSLRIASAYNCGSNTGNNNSYCIPTKIEGLN
jgi:hypothetical protein